MTGIARLVFFSDTSDRSLAIPPLPTHTYRSQRVVRTRPSRHLAQLVIIHCAIAYKYKIYDRKIIRKMLRLCEKLLHFHSPTYAPNRTESCVGAWSSGVIRGPPKAIAWYRARGSTVAWQTNDDASALYTTRVAVRGGLDTRMRGTPYTPTMTNDCEYRPPQLPTAICVLF